METVLLYAKDSESAYLKKFTSTITEIDKENKTIQLKETVFYPTGGGQPHDVGSFIINGLNLNIIGVKKSGLLVNHIVDEIPDSVSIGDQVEGEIDWELRFKYQRTHTAMHILCGIIYKEFNSTVTGGQIKKLEGRMDFDIDKFTKEKAQFIEDKCNEAIQKNFPIQVDFLPREIADQDPELIRTKVNLIPKELSIIRTVDIIGLDKQADGGTHVRTTKEVGKMTISKIDNKGKGRKRLYFTLSN